MTISANFVGKHSIFRVLLQRKQLKNYRTATKKVCDILEFFSNVSAENGKFREIGETIEL